jgi:hypothetical protein
MIMEVGCNVVTGHTLSKRDVTGRIADWSMGMIVILEFSDVVA